MINLFTPTYDEKVKREKKRLQGNKAGFNQDETICGCLKPNWVVVYEELPPYNDIYVLWRGIVCCQFINEFKFDVHIEYPEAKIIINNPPVLVNSDYINDTNSGRSKR